MPLFEHMKNAPMHLRTTNHHVCSYFFCVCVRVYIYKCLVYFVSLRCMFLCTFLIICQLRLFFFWLLFSVAPLVLLCADWGMAPTHDNLSPSFVCHKSKQHIHTICSSEYSSPVGCLLSKKKKSKVHQSTTSNHGNCVM